MGLPLLFAFPPITAPSSPALLPRGEKGAHHREHICRAVQFTSFFAPYSRHAADMFRSRASDYAALIEPTVSRQAVPIRTNSPP